MTSIRQLSADDLVSFALEDCVERTLGELAKAHDNKAGAWLDTIEHDVISDLKGSVASTRGYQPDHHAVRIAVDQVESIFNTFRSGLQQE